MINLKNILKVLLIALFVCAWSGEVRAGENNSGNMFTTVSECEQRCNGKCMNYGQGRVSCGGTLKPEEETKKETDTSGMGSTTQDPSFCSNNYGVFSELVTTGQHIFRRLRDLIYVVAGFGIIGVAVGGFFGNLNWKWLGAIVISLVVVATAGELIVLMTGCNEFGATLITNTLTNPTGMSTAEYNQNYTEQGTIGGWVDWNDSMDKEYRTSGGVSGGAEAEAAAEPAE